MAYFAKNTARHVKGSVSQPIILAALLWFALVVLVHYATTYFLDPHYSSAFFSLLSKLHLLG